MNSCGISRGLVLNKGIVRWRKECQHLGLLPPFSSSVPSFIQRCFSTRGLTLEASPPQQGSSSGCTLGHTYSGRQARMHAHKHGTLNPGRSTQPMLSRSEFLDMHPFPSAGGKSPPQPTPNNSTSRGRERRGKRSEETKAGRQASGNDGHTRYSWSLGSQARQQWAGRGWEPHSWVLIGRVGRATHSWGLCGAYGHWGPLRSSLSVPPLIPTLAQLRDLTEGELHLCSTPGQAHQWDTPG
jgi:hypothetical protein